MWNSCRRDVQRLCPPHTSLASGCATHTRCGGTIGFMGGGGGVGHKGNPSFGRELGGAPAMQIRGGYWSPSPPPPPPHPSLSTASTDRDKHSSMPTRCPLHPCPHGDSQPWPWDMSTDSQPSPPPHPHPLAGGSLIGIPGSHGPRNDRTEWTGTGEGTQTSAMASVACHRLPRDGVPHASIGGPLCGARKNVWDRRWRSSANCRQLSSSRRPLMVN